jgi:post-segregation antitoxin (ccd killing protein)
METAKVSVTIRRELLEQARALAGGNLSAFVSDAVEDRVSLEQARRAVEAYEAEHGVIPEELVEQALARWPSASA